MPRTKSSQEKFGYQEDQRILERYESIETSDGQPGFGLIKDPPDQRDYLLSSAKPISGIRGVPNKVDYSPEMSSVKNQGQAGCHDEETKILTDEGWKYFEYLNGEENVATINPQNFTIEFQKPVNYFKYYYEGPMFTTSSKTLDFKVTPNHRMWVRKWNQQKGRLSDNFEFVEAQNLGWYSGLATEFDWIGNNSEYFELEPVVIGPYNGDKYSIRKLPQIKFEDWAMFLGLYLAEGYVQKPNEKGNYRVGISSSVTKEWHRERVEEILSKIPVKWTEYKDRFVCNSKVLYENLKEFGKVYDKFVPEYIKNAKKDIIDKFIEGYAIGDGHIRNGVIGIWTSSEQMKDDLQELALKLGKYPSVYLKNNGKEETSIIEGRTIKATTPNYQVAFLYNTKRSIDKNKQLNKTNYSGYVYCVEVPNQTLITKRNEKILISGNSCVAFATAAVKEWQEQQEYLNEKKKGSSYKRESPEYDLSESWIYWNCKEIDNFPDSEGTSIRAGMKVLNKIGVPQEKAWPYTDDLSNAGKPKPWSKMTARWKRTKSYHRITTIDELIDHLANNGPVVAGVLVYRGFYYPDENGVVPMPAKNERPVGAHAIPICGYTKGANRQNYLIFKNSWGTDWGNNGFGSFIWKYWIEHSLDSWAVTDMNVTKEDIEGMWQDMK